MKKKMSIYLIMLLSILVGIHRGHIAIWMDEDPQPRYILPYSAELLPDADRKALERGIHLNSRRELTQFLEDFCS